MGIFFLCKDFRHHSSVAVAAGIFPGRLCWFDGVFCLFICLKRAREGKKLLFPNFSSESSSDLEEGWRVCGCDHVFPFPASIAIRAAGLPWCTCSQCCLHLQWKFTQPMLSQLLSWISQCPSSSLMLGKLRSTRSPWRHQQMVCTWAMLPSYSWNPA